jgi:hypothetical protein
LGWLIGISILLVPAVAAAQGTPLPLPSGPGGAPPPIYTEPPGSPTPGAVQSSAPTRPREAEPAAQPTAPPVTTTPAPDTEPATEEREKAEQVTDAATPRVPLVTSFPELTRGVGNSATLLSD